MGRITKEELSEELLSQMGSGNDSKMLDGKPASYYDQNDHVNDNSIHVTPELIDTLVDTDEANQLKEDSINESKSYTDSKLAELAQTSPEIYDAMMQVAELLINNPDTLAAVMDAIGTKVATTTFDNHVNAKNPHKMEPKDIGLGNVDNIADEDKVVLAATKLNKPVTIKYTGDVTGETTFDGEVQTVECQLTYDGGEDVPSITPGKYFQVEIDSKGRVISGYNPQKLEEFGIIDAATKEQGKKADSAIQEIYIGLWDKVNVIDGTAFLPEYPTDAETLQGYEPEDFAFNQPVSINNSGLMTPQMYLRLFGSPTQFDNISMYKEDKDENGIYRKVTYNIVTFDDDDNAIEHLYKTTQLFGEGPNYPTRIETIYVNDIVITNTYSLTYDEDGTIISEVVDKHVVTTVE